MIETLRQIAALQPEYQPENTPAMQKRGELIRTTLAAEVRELASTLAPRLEEFGGDFGVDASDGIGRKTEAPWVRFYSERMSPSPRDGFYCVIHFSADGSAFWVTIGCGSTVWNGGDLKALPDAELEARTGWARAVAADALGSIEPFTDKIALGAKAALPKTFEKATALALRFDPATAQEEAVRAALLQAADYLREIYRAQSVGAHLSPADIAEIEVEAIARPNRSAAAGQGIGLTGPERRAIELRGMALAREWLEGLGYSVKDKSQSAPFDFEATRDGETIKVEVKGTTAPSCSEFFMTRNEVELHRVEQGKTGLALVYGIKLHRDGNGGCEASGGTCQGEIGWDIGLCTLQPVAFRVSRPTI